MCTHCDCTEHDDRDRELSEAMEDQHWHDKEIDDMQRDLP